MFHSVNKFKIYTTVPHPSKYAVMFSGGKDCGLALAKVYNLNKNLHVLLHGVDLDNNLSLYHDQSVETIKAQAKSIDVDLIIIPNKIKWTHWGKLVHILNELRKQNVEYIVYGTLFDEEYLNYHGTLCNSAGLKICMPLWNEPLNNLMELIKTYNIEGIITNIDSRKLTNDCLGKTFDNEFFNYCLSLGLHPFGENGEFHSTLVNADFFRYRLDYTLGKVTERNIDLLFT